MERVIQDRRNYTMKHSYDVKKNVWKREVRVSLTPHTKKRNLFWVSNGQVRSTDLQHKGSRISVVIVHSTYTRQYSFSSILRMRKERTKPEIKESLFLEQNWKLRRIMC